MKSVAVIPARGGSKRIPGKNIRSFCGKPIIAYSIETALKCGLFDRVAVSTDDNEIAEIAQEYGADTFVRPTELADDFATTTEVMIHAVRTLSLSDSDLCCCIYATAPFISKEDLIEAYNNLNKNPELAYSFSATEFSFPIQRAFFLENGRVKMFQPEHLKTRSQDLEQAYHDAGQFYFGRASSWLSEKPVFGQDSVPVLLPAHRVQDIDNEADWIRAEFLYRANK